MTFLFRFLPGFVYGRDIAGNKGYLYVIPVIMIIWKK